MEFGDAIPNAGGGSEARAVGIGLTGMRIELSVRDEMLNAVPSLRAFAFSLTNDRSRADDLVQGTLARALTYIDRHKTGLDAWLFTILRNLFRAEHRKSKREVAARVSG